VVVILYPVPNPLLGRLKTPKLRSPQKLLIDRLPKPLDRPQRRGMMGLGFYVLHPVLPQLPLKPHCPAPVGVLPAPVGQHLLRLPRTPQPLVGIPRSPGLPSGSGTTPIPPCTVNNRRSSPPSRHTYAKGKNIPCHIWFGVDRSKKRDLVICWNASSGRERSGILPEVSAAPSPERRLERIPA